MRQSIFTITILLLFVLQARGQEVDLFTTDDNAKIELSADKDAIGADASIVLHRSDGLGKSLMRFDLKALSDRFTIEGEETWDMGIRSGHQFSLGHYKSSENFDGSINSSLQEALIIDHESGRSDEFIVQLPQGHLALGAHTTIKEVGDSTYFNLDGRRCLFIEGQYTYLENEKTSISTDYISISIAGFGSSYGIGSNAFVSANLDLGTICAPWNTVYADNYVVPTGSEDCDRDLVYWDKSKFNNGLKQILGLNPIKRTSKELQSSFSIEAESLSQLIPEAVQFENLDSNEEQRVTGIKYNQLIPVLVKAIQDQQNIISDMQIEITELKKK